MLFIVVQGKIPVVVGVGVFVVGVGCVFVRECVQLSLEPVALNTFNS